MLKNYHTHTWRCRHAKGEEREYIEAALRAGIQVLGFSDHVPMPGMPEGTYSKHRMFIEQLPEYMETLTALKAAYADRIEILIGFEAEYYPALFDGMLSLLAPYEYDYLLLGQHYLGNEWDTVGSVRARSDRPTEHLRTYVAQVTAGMRTGAFAYVAHPDIVRFDGDDATYAACMEPLLETALKMDIPLECNLLGVRDHREYPSERFFRLAAAYGCRVILGCDAHDPDALENREAEAAALALLERCGVKNLTDTLVMRR